MKDENCDFYINFEHLLTWLDILSDWTPSYLQASTHKTNILRQSLSCMKNYNNKPTTKWISVQLFWFIGAYDIRSYIDPSGTKMQTEWSLSTMQVMQFETQPTLSSVIFSSAFSETCLIYVGIYWQTIMVSMVS